MKEYDKLEYKIKVFCGALNEPFSWCHQNLGGQWWPGAQRSNKWAAMWAGFVNDRSTYQFSFAEEKDFIMFKLKFG